MDHDDVCRALEEAAKAAENAHRAWDLDESDLAFKAMRRSSGQLREAWRLTEMWLRSKKVDS